MELLAPAGTFDCVLTAVNSGADAVYFAGQEFGARSFAGNLTDEEIYRAADYCHLRGVRSYVTVNTLLYDKEYKDLEKFIRTLTLAGVDAVIVQDLGVLRLVRELSPDIELHASTQMTVHSADGVRELERLGVSRVVLSRELSGDEIRKIISSTKAETEVFVHGAMCMSYSGQCLMSSIIGGRSGNRGKCAQPCRLSYSDGDKTKYYLSLKDMMLADHIRELRDMGVSSLKIEGRMKGEAYVASVVSTYRTLIDEMRAPTSAEIDDLNKIFFRGGFTDKYFTGHSGPDMFAFDKPDNPYLKNDGKRKEKPKERRIETELYARFCEGDLPYISMKCQGVLAEVTGESAVQTAIGSPLTEESLIERLSKTGGTAFEIKTAKIELSGAPFVPVGAINELRRECVRRLEQKILEKYKQKRLGAVPIIDKDSQRKDARLTCSVLNIEQYRAIDKQDFEYIYVPLDMAEKYAGELSECRDKIVLCPPVILREPVREQYRDRLLRLKELGFWGAEVSTIDGIELMDGFEIHGSYRMNITNSLSADEVKGLGLFSVCLSAELNLAQLRDIKKTEKTEVIAYGRLPLMITENCILKNMDKCPCDGIGSISDRTGASFPIVRDGDICRSVVLNSVPLYMGDKLGEIKKTGIDYMRLMFTTESAEECRAVCVAYKNGAKSPFAEFTRLHFGKGALA